MTIEDFKYCINEICPFVYKMKEWIDDEVWFTIGENNFYCVIAWTNKGIFFPYNLKRNKEDCICCAGKNGKHYSTWEKNAFLVCANEDDKIKKCLYDFAEKYKNFILDEKLESIKEDFKN